MTRSTSVQCKATFGTSVVFFFCLYLMLGKKCTWHDGGAATVRQGDPVFLCPVKLNRLQHQRRLQRARRTHPLAPRTSKCPVTGSVGKRAGPTAQKTAPIGLFVHSSWSASWIINVFDPLATKIKEHVPIGR